MTRIDANREPRHNDRPRWNAISPSTPLGTLSEVETASAFGLRVGRVVPNAPFLRADLLLNCGRGFMPRQIERII
jgi:hypothetical protein